MREQVLLGVIAMVGGLVVAVLAFVPFVAVAYRRRGGLSARDVLLYVAVLVYLLAIWTYTLLPLPDPDALRCTTAQLDPWQFLHDLRLAWQSPHPLTHPAFLQLALNVLLFVPLGFLLRVVAHRGVLVATATGLAVSLLVETTQLTGVWGLYPCAYRVFDVDDLLTNTLGALAGSLLALLLPRQWRTRTVVDASEPRPVTRSRRIVAMLCDALTVALTALVLQVVVLLGAYAVGGSGAVRRIDDRADDIGVFGTLVLTLVFTLLAGRTVGDAAVQLRYVGGRRMPGVLLRFAGGIGGWQLLLALSYPGSGWVLLAFGLASIVAVLATADRRGLPGLLARQRLVDSRAHDGAVASVPYP